MKSFTVTLLMMFVMITPCSFGRPFGTINAASTMVMSASPSFTASSLLDLEINDDRHPAGSVKKEASLDIVQGFADAVERDNNYQKAANYLADDFQFLTPAKCFKSKDDWVRRFPSFRKSSGNTTFEDPIPGAHARQVIRRGKVKLAMFSVNLVAIYELDDHGKIATISARAAGWKIATV
jgi:hypothetical protein